MLLVSACGVSNDPNIEPEVEIKLTLEDSFGQKEDTFTQGENIRLVLTVTNHTEENFNLYYSQLRLRITTVLDIEIMDTYRTGGTTGISQVHVKPNETKEYSGLWDQELLDSGPIPPGEYTVYVSFEHPFTERKQRITIQ